MRLREVNEWLIALIWVGILFVLVRPGSIAADLIKMISTDVVLTIKSQMPAH